VTFCLREVLAVTIGLKEVHDVEAGGVRTLEQSGVFDGEFLDEGATYAYKRWTGKGSSIGK